MPEPSQPRTINTELLSRLGEIDTKLALIGAITEKLDRALNGNGRPGLIEDHRTLQILVADHLRRTMEDQEARGLLAKETKEAKELLAAEARESKETLAADVKAQREKISGRTWAVVFAVISVVITQAAALAVLFVRTGGIR